MLNTILPQLASVTPTQEGIINQLLPNGWVFLAHIIATVIILSLVIFFMWKPLNLMLQKRRDYFANQVKKTDTAKDLAQKNLQSSFEEIQKARVDSSRIIEAAKLEGYKIRQDLELEAKMYADRVKQDARDEIKKQEEALRKDIHNEIVTIAILAAEKIIQEKMNAKKEQVIIDHFVDDLIEKKHA